MVVNVIANVLSNTFFLVNKPFKYECTKQRMTYQHEIYQISAIFLRKTKEFNLKIKYNFQRSQLMKKRKNYIKHMKA